MIGKLRNLGKHSQEMLAVAGIETEGQLCCRLRYACADLPYFTIYLEMESLRKYAGRKITIPAVAHDKHDGGVLDLTRNAQRHGQRAAGRNATENAPFVRQATGHFFRILLADVLQLVHALRLKNSVAGSL